MQRYFKFIKTFLSRYIEPEFIHFLTAATIITACLGLIVACWTAAGGVNIYGSDTGSDFSTFYIAGTILNEYSPDRLYDMALQSKLYHLLLPGIPTEQELPFVNPPFFALILRPFAILPYIPAYLAWVAGSFLMYITGILLLLKALRSIPEKVSKTSLLIALSFSPFLYECALGGNSSAFGFFFISLTLYLERRNSSLLAGMVLGFCLYKPTWLVLLLPMLIITRQFRMLSGFILSAILLAGISLMVTGWQSCIYYLELLMKFSDAATGISTVFRDWKYVDLISFFRMLFGSPSLLSWIIIAITAAIPMFFLLVSWLKFKQKTRDQRDLVWACTLSWTPVFNIHFGIYDAIIIVAAVFLTMNVIYYRSIEVKKTLTPAFHSLLILLWLTPWITQISAQQIGFQLFTLVLFAVGVYQLLLLFEKNIKILPVITNSPVSVNRSA